MPATIFEYLFLFVIIWVYSKFSWSLWWWLGERMGKTFADLVDIPVFISFMLWMILGGHHLIAAFLISFWARLNLDREYQKTLLGKLETARHALREKS